MGLIHAQVKLTNISINQAIEIRAVVDTGIPFMCVTEEMTVQLGFDLSESSAQHVMTIDNQQVLLPKISPIEIEFENRSYVTEALVLADEALMGMIPLQAMDLVVDPIQQKLIVNPAHPNYPLVLAKSINTTTNWSNRSKYFESNWHHFLVISQETHCS